MKILQPKRLLSLLLAFSMTAVFPSCAEQEAADETETTDLAAAETVPEETEKPFLDDLPLELDFGGQEIRFLSAIETTSIEVTDEDDTGDVVIDAYWRRNEALEKRLQVDVKLVNQTGFNELSGVATQFITANSDDYDIICGHTRFNVALAAKQYMLNLRHNGFEDYIDLSKPYWSDLYTSNVNYKDNYYWLAGDMTHNFISYIY